MTRLLLALIALYRRSLAWLLGGHCRFLPSCSVYAEECVRRFGAWQGAWLSLRRLLRCHPFCEGGFDPPPGGLPAARKRPVSAGPTVTTGE